MYRICKHLTSDRVVSCSLALGCKFCREISEFVKWSEREDSNLRPSVPKTDALPGCATLRSMKIKGCTRINEKRQEIIMFIYKKTDTLSVVNDTISNCDSKSLSFSSPNFKNVLNFSFGPNIL